MKKLTVIFLVLALLIAPMPAFAARAAVTVLVYMCGSDLESESGEATSDLREMIRAGILDKGPVNVIVTTGGTQYWHFPGISATSNQIHKVTVDGLRTIDSIGDRNMGETDTLVEFLEYGFAQFPAERYILVLWDHGGGPVYGACYDEKHGNDSLTLAEMRDALAEGIPEGKKLDLICFDACLMNSVETFACIAPYAKYAVASQEMVSGTGMNYDEWLGVVAYKPDITTEEICKAISDTYLADNIRGKQVDTVTMSVVDLSRILAVEQAMNQFGVALSREMHASFGGVSRTRRGMSSFGEFIGEDASDLVDVSAVCTAFSEILPQETAALEDAVAEAILYNVTTGDIRGKAQGMSVFMPCNSSAHLSEIQALYTDTGVIPRYGVFAVAMAAELASGEYSFVSDRPESVLSGVDTGVLLSDIWGQLLGEGDTPGADSGSLRENTLSGIWDGLGMPAPDLSGLWSGLAGGVSRTGISGLWSGLNGATASSGLWGEYAGALDGAKDLFSASGQKIKGMYSLSLEEEEMEHLSGASGVLLMQIDEESAVELGPTGVTAVDWDGRVVYSAFDASWVRLNGQVVSMNAVHQEDGTVRAVIPVLANGVEMYLLAVLYRGSDTGKILGLTRGYDSDTGAAVRGFLQVAQGMRIEPIYDLLSLKTREKLGQIRGQEIIVGADGLRITRGEVVGEEFLFGLELTDIYGDGHITDCLSVDLSE